MHKKSNQPTISLQRITKAFKDVQVLDGIDLQVERGNVLALLGPNGAGKTTTVRILSTLLTPDSGQAMVNGYDVVKESGMVRASIGLTGQYAAVDEYLTGRDNLEMFGIALKSWKHAKETASLSTTSSTVDGH